MAIDKPRFASSARPMSMPAKLASARAKFGRPFAHEPGGHEFWKPRAIPLLTEWLQTRGRV